MKNEISYHRNLQKGVNMSINEGSHTVHVETGDRANSLEFWKKLKATADYVVANLEKPVVIHTVVLSKKKTRSRGL